MKSILVLTAALIASLAATAQLLPKPSPVAHVEQTVGVTKITVDYSRPSVKGRTIWGDLVPYGEVWRAGANQCTNIKLSTEVMLAGKPLAAGRYSVFVIPNEGLTWTVAINKDTNLWGAGDYKQENDVMRLEVPAVDHAFNESMEIHFVDLTNKSATLALDWEKKRLALPIMTAPEKLVMDNIQTALAASKEEDKWRIYRNAAGYARDEKMTAQGLKWIEQSIALKETWYSFWLYGELLAQNGDKKGAIKQAEKSIELGKADAAANSKTFDYEADIKKDIEQWSAM